MTTPERRLINSWHWRTKIVPRVVRRDNGYCHLCDLPGATSADHLVPRKYGGTNRMDNLKAAHDSCNKIRGDRSVEWARARIAARNAGTSFVPPTAPETWQW